MTSRHQPHLRRLEPTKLKLIASVGLMVCALLAPLLIFAQSDAVLLSYRHLELSDNSVSASGVNYKFTFNTNTSGPIGSIKFDICENYQYDPGDACTIPVGFSASSATLASQSGIADFSLSPSSTDRELILSRPAVTPVSPQQLTYEFTNLTNPSTIGSDYVRISTYPTLDASGPETDYGVVVFAVNQGIGIQTEVPPYLLFCTGITIDGYNCGTAQGNFISFGELSSRTTRTATSQLLASTNAPYGYTVTLAGATMTAGNNVISAMTANAPSLIGTSQFGLNSRANSAPSVGSDPDGPGLTSPRAGYNTPNSFKFGSGDIFSSSTSSDDYRKLTVSYIVNVPKDQPAGDYAATVSYICLANF